MADVAAYAKQIVDALIAGELLGGRGDRQPPCGGR